MGTSGAGLEVSLGLEAGDRPAKSIRSRDWEAPGGTGGFPYPGSEVTHRLRSPLLPRDGASTL